MIPRSFVFASVGLLLTGLGTPVLAQNSASLEAICEDAIVASAGAEEECLATAQAVVSAQSALGILIAGGNPTPGGAEVAGLGLGLARRASVGLRVNIVSVALPDIVAQHVPDELNFVDSFGAAVPALSADLSVRLLPGWELAPGVAGLGGLSLLATGTYLPFEMFSDEFEEGNLAYGVGGRLHLLSESFVAPAVSLSLMWRRLPDLEFGDVCPAGTVPIAGETSEGVEVGACAGGGDPGEIAFDLTDLSGRAVVSKQLLGLGGAFGMGFDRFESDLDFGFRGSEMTGTGSAPTFRVDDREIESTRWTVFGSLSYTVVVATFSLEAGWQQGKPPITGFSDLGGDFDPENGTWYGSLGARLSL
jgi:hypothetical protein